MLWSRTRNSTERDQHGHEGERRHGGTSNSLHLIFSFDWGTCRSSVRPTRPGVTDGGVGTPARIEKYLGFPAGISGSELTSRAVTQGAPVDGLADYEGISIFYAAGPPEAHLCGGQRVGVGG